jgi:hypothetical protein
LSTEAGLTPQDTFDVSWAYRYEDDDTLARDMVAVGGLAELAGPARVDGLRASILEARALRHRRRRLPPRERAPLRGCSRALGGLGSR